MVGNKAQKAVAAALTGLLAFGSVAPALAGTKVDGDWYRIDGTHSESWQIGKAMSGDDATGVTMSGTKEVAGKNRYDTMWDAINYNIVDDGPWAADSLYTLDNKENKTIEVVIASGSSQADSLVASGLAGQLNNYKGAPVIMTKSDELVTQAERVLQYYYDYLKDGDDNELAVYIVGGTAAISQGVEDAIADIEEDDKANVYIERFDGKNRQETSLKVFQRADLHWLDDDDEESIVYIANGTAWPDALSVSSFAYLYGDPILLTDADGKLTADQIDALSKDKVTIKAVGGPAVPSVQQLFDAGFDRAGIDQIAGKNRYETSAMVIEDSWDELFGWRKQFNTIAVANGTEAHWADALIGGPFVAARNGVLALVDGVDEVTALKAAYTSKEAGTLTEDSYIIGGEAAISEAFAKKLGRNFPATSGF